MRILTAISLDRGRNFPVSIVLVLLSLIVPPLLFGLAYVSHAAEPISLASASSILSGAITVNGVILGFVLLVLFDNATKAKKTAYHPDYLARNLIMILDAAFLILSLREIYREMISLATLPANPTLIVVIDSFFIPWRFAIYVVIRMGIIVLLMKSVDVNPSG